MPLIVDLHVMLINSAGRLGEHLEDQARRFGDHVLHVEWRTQDAKLRPTELAWIDADGDVGTEGTAAFACGLSCGARCLSAFPRAMS